MPDKMPVLVVEDEPIIAVDVEDTLIKAGFEVYIASTVEEAIRIVLTRALNLAILDFYLGSDNSVEVARTLRQKGITFFVSTASQEFREIGREVFHDTMWLKKPFSDEQLIEMVNIVLATP